MISRRRPLLAGLFLALAVAGVLSYYASASPDGRNRVLGCLVVLAFSSLLFRLRRAQDPEPIPVRARHRREGE